ncbi:MAG: DUF433 domain-containing protein [Caulobacterales bacterium]|nr:DUF433 domain-containing protein [Caulobacterales bacterium]
MMPWHSNWHDQWIDVDADLFEGQPHIRGTARTVSEVQKFWKQAGVGAKEVRAKFPELTEAQLGAAVTYASPVIPVRSYVGEWIGPPHRKFYLWKESDSPEGDPGFSGWMFQYTNIEHTGNEALGWDVWEASLAEILRYPPEYGPRDVVWRDDRTGLVVDIYALIE